MLFSSDDTTATDVNPSQGLFLLPGVYFLAVSAEDLTAGGYALATTFVPGHNPFNGLDVDPALNRLVGTNPVEVIKADFNGDGILDLATVNQGSANAKVLLGTATGPSQLQVRYPVGGRPDAIAAVDYNGDGRLDEILPGHLLPHNRENSTDGNGTGREARARDRSVRRDRLRVRACLCGGGADVVVHYHRGQERAEELAAEIGAAGVVGADLTQEEEVDSMFAAAGTLDVCAAVAGVWPSDDIPVWDLPLERWRATLDANLTATFLTARGFLGQLEGDGALILVGSTAGIVGEAGHADYAAAKSAILGGLLLSLKNEVVSKNPLARVNAVAPGWTESPMTRGHVSEEQVRRISRTMALRKVAQPEDVAGQVVALASPVLSGHVTGQVVTVAGGMEGRVIHDS